MKVELTFEAFSEALNITSYKAEKQSECVFFIKVAGLGKVELNTKGTFIVGSQSSRMDEIVSHCHSAGWETVSFAKAWTNLQIKSPADVMKEYISLVRHIESLPPKGKVSKKSAEVVQLKPVATDGVKAKNLEMIRLAARKNKK
jgi:hypothetical protein